MGSPRRPPPAWPLVTGGPETGLREYGPAFGIALLPGVHGRAAHPGLRRLLSS